MAYWGFPRYVSVGEKRQRSKRKLEQLKKKNRNITPVIIEGSTLTRTWWGKAWNKNLEGYADYSNRIGRGRSYVRCGSVLDLQISEGKVQSLVQGSVSRPYSVAIKIRALQMSIWEKIKGICEGKLDSLQGFLVGKFPRELGETFTEHGTGLFPTPKEISFECSCPDWASMCKHVAATLYGVGTRLDEDPNLFFVLRKIEINDLITEAVKSKTEKLLTKAKRKSGRIIEDQDLSSVFGIKLDSVIKPAKMGKVKVSGKDKTTKSKNIDVKKKKTTLKKAPSLKASSVKASSGKTHSEKVASRRETSTKTPAKKIPSKKPTSKKPTSKKPTSDQSVTKKAGSVSKKMSKKSPTQAAKSEAKVPANGKAITRLAKKPAGKVVAKTEAKAGKRVSRMKDKKKL